MNSASPLAQSEFLVDTAKPLPSLPAQAIIYSDEEPYRDDPSPPQDSRPSLTVTLLTTSISTYPKGHTQKFPRRQKHNRPSPLATTTMSHLPDYLFALNHKYPHTNTHN